MADSLNVWAATIPATGAAVSVAPLGTTLPTTATEALDAGFTDLGWINEGGVTNSVKRDTTKHYAWGGDVIKVTMDRYTETLKFQLAETSAVTLQTVFGTDNVTVDGDTITVEHSSDMLPRQSFCIDFVDGDMSGRILVRDGQITEIGDIKYDQRELVLFDLTVDVFKGDDGVDGVVAFYDGVTPPGS